MVSVQTKILQLGFVVLTASVVMECSRRVRHLAAVVAWTFPVGNSPGSEGLFGLHREGAPENAERREVAAAREREGALA